MARLMVNDETLHLLVLLKFIHIDDSWEVRQMTVSGNCQHDCLHVTDLIRKYTKITNYFLFLIELYSGHTICVPGSHEFIL